MRVIFLCIFSLVLGSIAEPVIPTKMVYSIRRASELKPKCSAEWNDSCWENASEFRVLSFLPESAWTGADIRGRLLYDDRYIYGIFQVKDKYLQSTHQQINSYVWQDSCVEFYFSPGSNEKFFNVEINHAGVILANFNRTPYQDKRVITHEDIRNYIKTRGSIPNLIQTEIEGPVTWTLEFRIDRALIDKYYTTEKGLPKDLGGSSWTGNFYHSADNSSHPRWAAWSQVPILKFHMPECFGILKFEH